MSANPRTTEAQAQALETMQSAASEHTTKNHHMKPDHIEICPPISGICKQHAIWAGEGNGMCPLVYLQRPKWIKSDEAWEKIVDGIRLSLPSGFEVS